MSHHDSLNISLQTENRRYDQRISKTIDLDNKSEGEPDIGDNEERVRKFRELYYRNQKLRKQLKNLNVKFPSVKKRSASVDLNHIPPSKALVRQLQNASKQVKLYKKQIQILKVKQQSQYNYEKLKNMENAIAYKDIQINDIQKQLVSIKNIKKMQQKSLDFDLQNQQVKQRIGRYQKQHKQLKEKLKQIAKQSRKKQQNYKKQQAYALQLQRKSRDIDKNLQQEKQKIIQRPYRQITLTQMNNIKKQLQNQKKQNDQVLKKIQIAKKIIKKQKQQQKQLIQKFKDKDALSKQCNTKIQNIQRLIRQQQRRQKTPPKNKLITKIQQLSFDDNDSNSNDQAKNPTVSKDDQSLQNMLNKMSQIQKSQRNWKGNYRKVQNGFGAPNDKKFQFQGQLAGFKVSLDQSQFICGIICIFRTSSGNKQQPVQGKRSNVQLQWIADKNDSIAKIYGSFTQQSYLNQLVVVSRSGKSGVFGNRAQDSFSFIIQNKQKVSGCFGAVRQLGQDTRITELGFWIQRSI